MSDSLLAQLRRMTLVVADSGDFESIERFKPKDSTTNPSLIAVAARMPKYAALVDDVLLQVKDELGAHASHQRIANVACRRLAVAFGRKILALVTGRVSTEVDARLSFDREATLEQAYDIIEQYRKAGVSKERVLIKIAATWEGIQAAKYLEREGIHCNLTLLFGLHQAAACAAANVTLISPFVGRISDWYQRSTGRQYTGGDDPGVQSVTRIYHYLKQHGYRTVVMGASFRNTDQIKQLAGCDLLTVSPRLLDALNDETGDLPRVLWEQDAKYYPMERLSLDRDGFERMHEADFMTRELLTQGIEGFGTALQELETVLERRLFDLSEELRPALAAS